MNLEHRYVRPKSRVADTVGRLGLELKAANERAVEAEYRADHDEMTGLLNKSAWRRVVQSMIDTRKPLGVIFTDMDEFKQVNSDVGHIPADELIKARARRLEKLFNRHGDKLAHETLHSGRASESAIGRFGGDEFGVAIDLSDLGGERPDSPQEEMGNIIARMRFQLSLPIVLKDEAGGERTVSDYGMSIGGALWTPGCGFNASELLAAADHQMYLDKQNRKVGR